MPTIRVLAAAIQRNERYLVCQRPHHKRHGGLWEFPGGKMETGETIVDAACREMKEELGVDVSGVGEPLLAVADEGSDFVIEFVPTEIIGDPRLIEHADFRWVSLTELPAFDLAPSDRRFVEFLLNRETPGSAG